MAAPFGVTLSGLGLELNGMAFVPFPYPSATYLIDGLGLATFGFVWNAANVWYSPYDPVTTTWTGCSTCAC